MTSEGLEDRLLIRELYAEYSDAAFQGDRDAWLDCYAEDGIWLVFGKEIRGKIELSKQWDETWKSIERMAFFAEVGHMELLGQKANVRSYCHEIVSLKNGSLFKVVAQYSDELCKLDGRWLFAKRVYEILIKE